MHTPKVTIIITCFNHQNYVIESIKSVLNQSYQNIEIVIIDDFSDDKSVQTIESFIENYPELKFIKNDRNLGHTKSFNQILSFCESDFIMDLSADDFLEHDCIAQLVSTYNNINKNEYFAVYSNCNLVNENGNFIQAYYLPDFQNLINEDAYCAILSAENKICSASALLNYNIFKRLNGFDTTLAYEDLDYWIRASRQFKIKYIPNFLVNKRQLPNSLYAKGFSRNKLAKKLNRSTIKILNQAFKSNKIKQEDLSLLKRVHFEMVKNLKNYAFLNVLKLSFLELKCRFRKF